MALGFPAHLELDTSHECGVRTNPAFDRLRQCRVAVKRAAGVAAMEGLENEWRLLQRLSPGPYVTPLEFRRLGPEESYLTSLWVEGESFASFAGRHAGPEVYAVTQQALLGVARLHRAGYVHGDIRPENLLIANRLDTALVQWLDLEQATRYGCLSAGFSYTESWCSQAPEGGQALDPRADLLAFGELLGHSLEETSDAGSAWIALLREFAGLLCDGFRRAQIADAEEARYALATMAAAGSTSVHGPSPDVRPPVPVARRRAASRWRQLLAHWRREGGRQAICVRGPRGCGKTTFLRQALADAAACGHAVLDLLDDSHGALTEATDAELLHAYLRDTPLPAIVALRHEYADRFFAGVAGALPETALLLTETSGDPRIEADLSLPDGWALADWSFPAMDSREWFQWVGAST